MRTLAGRFASSIDKVNKKVLAYGKQMIYVFPCKSRRGDHRFVSDNSDFEIKSVAYLKKIIVKDCDWVIQYNGTGLNGYDQRSEFSEMYIVERTADVNQIKIIKVSPDLAEIDSMKDW